MTVIAEIGDVEKVLGFLAAMLQKLNLLVESGIEDSFVIDMYGDDPNGVFGFIGTQNQGLYRQYNGPFLITDILATWGVTPATQGASLTKQGTATGPGALATIASIASVPAGTYSIEWTVGYGSGAVAAAEQNNMQLAGLPGGVLPAIIPAVANTTQPQQTVQDVVLTAPTTITVQSIGAGTATAVYEGQLVITPIAAGAGPTTVTLQLGDRILQFPPASGVQSLNDLKLEMQRDDVIALTVTPKAACHLEILGNVKKRARESTHS